MASREQGTVRLSGAARQTERALEIGDLRAQCLQLLKSATVDEIPIEVDADSGRFGGMRVAIGVNLQFVGHTEIHIGQGVEQFKELAV